VLVKQGSLDTAEPLLREARAIRAELFPEVHPSRAAGLNAAGLNNVGRPLPEKGRLRRRRFPPSKRAVDLSAALRSHEPGCGKHALRTSPSPSSPGRVRDGRALLRACGGDAALPPRPRAPRHPTIPQRAR
jgi:hypothetical protein